MRSHIKNLNLFIYILLLKDFVLSFYLDKILGEVQAWLFIFIWVALGFFIYKMLSKPYQNEIEKSIWENDLDKYYKNLEILEKKKAKVRIYAEEAEFIYMERLGVIYEDVLIRCKARAPELFNDE